MIRREVILAPEARDDLLHLYGWIAETASPEIALGYLDRIESHILGFETASERGTRRDDIRTGLRVTGFEKRITIAFHVTDKQVIILRIFYGGQDWVKVLDE